MSRAANINGCHSDPTLNFPRVITPPMADDLYSLAYEQLTDMECRECGAEPRRGKPRLSISDSENISLVAEYTCPECSTNHHIEVVDSQQAVETTVTRTDTGDSYRIVSGKDGLRLSTHTTRETIDDLGNLESCFRMLRFNKEQFDYLTENTPEYAKDDDFPGGTWQHPILTDHMMANIHNYLTSAYTFEETFQTLRERLPTGEVVETQFQEYHQNSRVIIGLRTYIQHEQLFQFSINPDLDADSYKIRFMVDLDDVWRLESQSSSDDPLGYDTHPERLFEDVDGDSINLEDHIDRHFRHAAKLVETTKSYVHDELEDDIESFYDHAEQFSINDDEEKGDETD